MIWETGNIDEADVGFYSGLIVRFITSARESVTDLAQESLFSLTQMCLMIPWGHAADKFGRKPILYLSLFGTGISTMLFGFSTSIWQMVLFRCIAGMFAGSVVYVILAGLGAPSLTNIAQHHSSHVLGKQHTQNPSQGVQLFCIQRQRRSLLGAIHR